MRCMGKRFNCQYDDKLIENTNVMKRNYNQIDIMILHRNIHPFTTNQSIFHNLYFNLLEFEWFILIANMPIQHVSKLSTARVLNSLLLQNVAFVTIFIN